MTLESNEQTYKNENNVKCQRFWSDTLNVAALF